MSGSVVNFDVYPSSNRVPNVYFEVDASNANTTQFNQRTLLVGQVLPTGTAPLGIPFIATGQTDIDTACGVGSMLAKMFTQYRIADSFGEVWLLPLADNPAAVATQVAMTITGPATAAGTLNVYVTGQQIEVGVQAGDSPSTIATDLANAVGTYPQLPCTAVASGNSVTFTAKNKGGAAGDLDVQINYYGAANGEFTPAGVAVSVSTSTTGVTDPDATQQITAALANIPDDFAIDFIAYPYTGAAALHAIEQWLSDQSGRWSYVSEMFGGAFSAFRGSMGQCTSFGMSNNNQHLSILAYYNSPTPAYLVAADYCGTCAGSLRADPAMPLQYLYMNWLAPKLQDRFTFTERNSLYYTGLSCFKVNDANQVVLERATTTFQQNAAGAPDSSYLDVETLYTLMALIRDLRTDLQTKFARRKLVADGTRIPYGVNFVTAQIVGNEVVSNYRKNAAKGLCQNPDTFARTMVATNAGNGTVAIMAPFDLANQLRVIAVRVEFLKS